MITFFTIALDWVYQQHLRCKAAAQVSLCDLIYVSLLLVDDQVDSKLLGLGRIG